MHMAMLYNPDFYVAKFRANVHAWSDICMHDFYLHASYIAIVNHPNGQCMKLHELYMN